MKNLRKTLCLLLVMVMSFRTPVKAGISLSGGLFAQETGASNSTRKRVHAGRVYQDLVFELDALSETLTKDNSHANMISHRGYNLVAPENSMAAFKRAVKAGFKMIETDVRMTFDQVPVLMHDCSVDRTTNGEGQVECMNYSELSEFLIDAGNGISCYAKEHIPTLYEFLSLCRSYNVTAILDLKISNKEDLGLICQMVAELGMEQLVIFQGKNEAGLKLIRKRIPEARLWYLTRYLTVFDVYKARHLSCEAVNAKYLNGSNIRNAHRHKLSVCCWDGDDKKGRIVYAANGIDYMMTDKY